MITPSRHPLSTAPMRILQDLARAHLPIWVYSAEALRTLSGRGFARSIERTPGSTGPWSTAEITPEGRAWLATVAS